jgi:hypothetical protein
MKSMGSVSLTAPAANPAHVRMVKFPVRRKEVQSPTWIERFQAPWILRLVLSHVQQSLMFILKYSLLVNHYLAKGLGCLHTAQRQQIPLLLSGLLIAPVQVICRSINCNRYTKYFIYFVFEFLSDVAKKNCKLMEIRLFLINRNLN